MRLQVFNAAIRVAQREFRQFHAHRVDGKVAPERRFLEAEFFVGMHHETAVTVAHLAFRAREREIERKPLHGEVNHAKSLPDQIRAAIFRKYWHEGILRHVVDFDIVVPAALAQKRIAYPAAHQEGATARIADIACDFQ